MKFGRTFHLRQVPEWGSFYVDYNQLKNSLKIAVETGYQSNTEPDLTEFHKSLSYNVDASRAFRNDKYGFLHKKGVEICDRYGISELISIISQLEMMDREELKDLHASLLELRTYATKLQWYERVNQHAIRKISGKLEKLGKSSSRADYDYKFRWLKLQLAWRGECLKDVEELNTLLRAISLARSNANPGAVQMSLYLKGICDRLSLPVPYSSAVYQAVKDDEVSALAESLQRQKTNKTLRSSHLHVFLCALLELSMICHSRKCAVFLISNQLPKSGIPVSHHCLHYLIAATGRNKLLAESANAENRVHEARNETYVEAGTSLFLEILDCLRPMQEDVLQTRDTFGQTPLHYAAQYGLIVICQSILESLQASEQSSNISSAILSQDSQGATPLHAAVIHNHGVVTKLLLGALQMCSEARERPSNVHTRSLLSDLLIIALRAQYDEAVNLLGSSYNDPTYRSRRGETPIYVAAQMGNPDYVKTLLKAAAWHKSNIDVAEIAHGWTPLYVACVEGHTAVVELLLGAGANEKIVDQRGWTAKEHAAFRGHLTIAGMLQRCSTPDTPCGASSTPVKAAFNGNPCLRSGQSYVIVNLGVLQDGQQIKMIDLSWPSSLDDQSLATDTRFSIEVSVPGTDGPCCFLQLPILDDMVDEAFVFPIMKPGKPRLVFKVFCASAAIGKKGVLIGSGTALLEGHSHHFGAKRESLIRQYTVPILERETFNFMGTVTFTFVIVKPFALSGVPPTTKYGFGEHSVEVVGHRGFGQNVSSYEHLQLGENTVESFLSAVKLGASFVEFDVQLTRDLVPVVYHDFSLSESGTDVPIHDLSLKQFMYASTIQSPRGDPVSILGRTNLLTNRSIDEQGRRRTRSLTMEREHGANEVRDRMKHTFDFMDKGFKPNTRGDFIQDSFATLEELLKELPRHIKFDIEIKYPRLHEAVDAGVAPIGIELNTFVDTILDMLSHFGGDRTIILSSFSPDVCILLALKQQRYPVMFITNAGRPPPKDREMRAGSLQVAIRFAKRWSLAGIVFASETLIMCPRLIGYVRRAGLGCASYGPLNNIPDNARLQVAAGLEMIMVDRVALISRVIEDCRS